MPQHIINPTAHPLIAADPLIVRLVALYLADCQYRALRPKTIEFYTFTLHNFCWWLAEVGEVQEPANFTPALLKAFLVYVRSGDRWGRPRPNTAAPAAESTVRSYAVALRAFFNWCVAEGQISANPMTGPDPHRPRVPLPRVADPRVQPFSEDQIRALLACCDSKTPQGCRDAALIYFLLDTGCRASEACTLRLGDYDATSGAWTVAGAKTGAWRHGRLPPASRRALARWLVNYRPRYGSPPDTVFVGLSDRGVSQLTPNGLTHRLQDLGTAAGLVGVRCSAHTFRHTFAVWYLVDGGDPASLQLLLGHSSLKMTMRYLHLSQADLASLSQQHAPSARLTKK